MNLFDKWLNESRVIEKEGLLQIPAPGNTDFFIRSGDRGNQEQCAVFLYRRPGGFCPAGQGKA